MSDPRTVIRDKVAEAIYHAHRPYKQLSKDEHAFIYYQSADAALAVVYRRIDTVDELDALPPSSVILTAFGSAAQRAGGPGSLVDGWFLSGGGRPVADPSRMLRARVLYRPGESR